MLSTSFLTTFSFVNLVILDFLLVVDWFHSYLFNRQSFVRISGTLSSSYLVKSGAPQGSTLVLLLFNIFINDIGDSICNSKYLLFADDLKKYRSIRNVDDCKLLRHDIDSVQNWYLVNGMKLNFGKTTIISFTRKTNSIYFNYKLRNNLVSRSQCVKDLGVLLDCKLYFHQHIDYIFSQCLKMSCLIRYITSSFSTLDSLLVLYCTLFRSKLEYASVVWNSITSTDSSKLERIQWKFAALYFTRLFNGVCYYNCEDIVLGSNLWTLELRRKNLDALSLIDVFIGKILCSSILDSVSLRLPSRSSDYFTVTANRNFKVSPSARCVSAANAVCRSIDIFNKGCISLKNISQSFKLICSSFSYKYLYICFVSSVIVFYFVLPFISVLACNWFFSCCQAR
jgi:hypothetical protein